MNNKRPILITACCLLSVCSNLHAETDQYVLKMQNISQETELVKANNELLEAKVKGKSLENKLQGNDRSNEIDVSLINSQNQGVINQPKMDKGVSELKYGLLQVYGMNNHLTAVLQYGENIIPVKKGDTLDGIWQIEDVLQNEVILINQKSHQKKFLYLVSSK